MGQFNIIIHDIYLRRADDYAKMGIPHFDNAAFIKAALLRNASFHFMFILPATCYFIK